MLVDVHRRMSPVINSDYLVSYGRCRSTCTLWLGEALSRAD
jgi:hypothetical protein